MPLELAICEAAVDLRWMIVLVIGRARRPHGQQVVVRGAGGMRELADGGRFLVANHRAVSGTVVGSSEARERLDAVGAGGT